ncbi:aspartate/glutamate racemase family protein [Treponema primitia]|uniref:aspartate/glutamate racemase family protein n=1 Tax=Treponema primitia TaxID=88058 RepID=UPI000255575A|nr:aspartate/glutamate racemase family protein [Treponema primitia]
MRLLNIVPITTDIWNTEYDTYCRKYLLPDTKVETKKLTHGPASIESEYDEALAVPEVVFLCREAEKEGFDAVFINCFGDPGVRAARERVHIPVFGGFGPAIFYSLGIADRIGIVTVLPDVVSMLRGLIAKEGLKERVTSLRYVSIPVLDLSGIEKLISALITESKKAIDEDGVGSIVLGCTAMIGVKEAVEKGLRADGYNTVVIEAAQASLMMCETYVRMGLSHSRITYMPPRDKERFWWTGDGVLPIK